MSHRDYMSRRREDPEYCATERRMKPFLDIAKDVFLLRMERGWTQADLAKRVGTRQANISRLENGLANPTLQFLQKLSEALGTELVVHLGRQPAESYYIRIREFAPVYLSVDDEDYWEARVRTVAARDVGGKSTATVRGHGEY